MFFTSPWSASPAVANHSKRACGYSSLQPSQPYDRHHIGGRVAYAHRVEEDRRSPRQDRRRSSRSGRRDDDPSPLCSYCGLPAGNRPHASDEDCVGALRAEVGRLRELISNKPKS